MNELWSKLVETCSANIMDGLSAMLIGMGTVLTFLCILIISMLIMSKVVLYLNKIFPETVPHIVKKPAQKISDDAGIAVAVLAAMMKK